MKRFVRSTEGKVLSTTVRHVFLFFDILLLDNGCDLTFSPLNLAVKPCKSLIVIAVPYLAVKRTRNIDTLLAYPSHPQRQHRG